MDTTAIVIIALLVLVSVAAMIVYREKIKLTIQGWGMKFGLVASNEKQSSSGGATLEDAESKAGKVSVIDETGTKAKGKRIKAQKDIEVRSSPPPGDSKKE